MYLSYYFMSKWLLWKRSIPPGFHKTCLSITYTWSLPIFSITSFHSKCQRSQDHYGPSAISYLGPLQVQSSTLHCTPASTSACPSVSTCLLPWTPVCLVNHWLNFYYKLWKFLHCPVLPYLTLFCQTELKPSVSLQPLVRLWIWRNQLQHFFISKTTLKGKSANRPDTQDMVFKLL